MNYRFAWFWAEWVLVWFEIEILLIWEKLSWTHWTDQSTAELHSFNPAFAESFPAVDLTASQFSPHRLVSKCPIGTKRWSEDMPGKKHYQVQWWNWSLKMDDDGLFAERST